MLSAVGLLGGLALLVVLTMRGTNLLIAAPVCAVFVAALSGIPLVPSPAGGPAAGDFVAHYMGGFAGFLKSYFFVFLMGAIFGKVMEDSGAAASVAQWAVGRFGASAAVLAVVVACAILTYGGVSLFVVAFAVYPLAVNLFRAADLPRRFIPGALAFGSVTFTMTSAGSPEIQNWIPIEFLHTSPYAGWRVSAIVAVAMAALGYWALRRMIAAAVAGGERFRPRADDPVVATRALPGPLLALLPLLTVLVVSFLLHDRFKQSALLIALTAGVAMCSVLNRVYFVNFSGALTAGAVGALIAIGNTCAVVGFGSVAKATPAFHGAVSLMTGLPGSPLIGAAVAVSVIAGITGSASGGLGIALPILAPIYLALGVDPGALHRVASIASGSLDSLPHNGYVVTTIRAVCGESHRDAYGAVGVTTVLVPTIGVILAIGLFSLGL
ncbi:MAG: GntP family permease [Opitutus sp.]|nr:GntP family permease [Opitutus sp.]